jgi:hypothetical protein
MKYHDTKELYNSIIQEHYTIKLGKGKRLMMSVKRFAVLF